MTDTETVFERLDREEGPFETPIVTERDRPNPYVCQVCGREFTSAQGVGAHQGSHYAKKVPCEFCGKEYMNGAGMGRHLSTAHNVSDRPQSYKDQRKECAECGKTMRAKDMARHMRDVHKKKPEVKPLPRAAITPKPEPLTADQIVKAAAAMLWPTGIPHDQLDALMVWHRQTVAFLSQA